MSIEDINPKFHKNIQNLDEFERYVIVDKGTERAFSGALLENKEEGTYICKLCKAPLFKSSAKFNSGTGWPSFDDALP
jgi:peptide methionine sulfoxide reductase MsrB